MKENNIIFCNESSIYDISNNKTLIFGQYKYNFSRITIKNIDNSKISLEFHRTKTLHPGHGWKPNHDFCLKIDDKITFKKLNGKNLQCTWPGVGVCEYITIERITSSARGCAACARAPSRGPGTCEREGAQLARAPLRIVRLGAACADKRGLSGREPALWDFRRVEKDAFDFVKEVYKRIAGSVAAALSVEPSALTKLLLFAMTPIEVGCSLMMIRAKAS